jgi:hypothetical protein
VKLRSEDSSLPGGNFLIIPGEFFNDLESIAAIARQRRICRRKPAQLAAMSRMTAQYAIPIAIAVAEMAAAERRRRTVIKLIVDAAMIRAIGPAGEILERAMIAKARRQLLRALPIDEKDGAVRGGKVHFARQTGGRRRNKAHNSKYDGSQLHTRLTGWRAMGPIASYLPSREAPAQPPDGPSSPMPARAARGWQNAL